MAILVRTVLVLHVSAFVKSEKAEEGEREKERDVQEHRLE